MMIPGARFVNAVEAPPCALPVNVPEDEITGELLLAFGIGIGLPPAATPTLPANAVNEEAEVEVTDMVPDGV